MIEELKLLLDQMKNVPDVALWILGGFLIYKLVTYLSMTGAIVFIVKMLCKTVIDWRVKPSKAKFRSILIDNAEDDLEDFLKGCRNGSRYIHESDVHEMQKAWNAWQDAKKQRATN